MEIVVFILLGIICIASVISMILILRAQTRPRDNSVEQGIEALKERTAVVRDSLLEMRGSSESSQRALRSELSGSVKRLGDSLRLEQGAAAKNTAVNKVSTRSFLSPLKILNSGHGNRPIRRSVRSLQTSICVTMFC